ncbi:MULTISPECIES: imidazolonepropionase-like domain-containing protein [unclassified Streptomyces]|uniref:Aminodeoxyfutalosine deaminase/Imidazolonepropionase-like composite domain-containing protein n=1 Tax=Streptomyces sp. NBC_00060 TaxID=2975636 RepID=A0AAU2H120_9ACTN
MLTLHAPAVGDAVVVEGSVVAAIGPYEELAAAYPAARVRRWPGVLLPGLVNPYGPELLERAYHPDPREADELGTEPILDPAFAMDDARRGGSARRGVQRMLAHGVVAVAGELRSRSVVEAVRRSGVAVVPRASLPSGTPSLAAGVVLPPLRVGDAARFAVFEGAVCVATVLDGRLVYRAR